MNQQTERRNSLVKLSFLMSHMSLRFMLVYSHKKKSYLQVWISLEANSSISIDLTTWPRILDCHLCLHQEKRLSQSNNWDYWQVLKFFQTKGTFDKRVQSVIVSISS